MPAPLVSHACRRMAHLINNLTDDINEIPHETTMFHRRGSARVEQTIFEKTTAPDPRGGGRRPGRFVIAGTKLIGSVF
jgi:hypothetical protein